MACPRSLRMAPGRLAQLGEHQLDKLGVTGSSPVPPTSRKPRHGGVFAYPVRLLAAVPSHSLSMKRSVRWLAAHRNRAVVARARLGRPPRCCCRRGRAGMRRSTRPLRPSCTAREHPARCCLESRLDPRPVERIDLLPRTCNESDVEWCAHLGVVGYDEVCVLRTPAEPRVLGDVLG
jgi:hypothetical protein